MGKGGISSNKEIFDFSEKEITIPLDEYVALIENNTVLNQVKTVVSKDDSEYGAVPILRAILQIDMQKKE